MVKKSFLMLLIGFAALATLIGCASRNVYEPAESGSYGYVGVDDDIDMDYDTDIEEDIPNFTLHEVQIGENLNWIAQMYDLDPELILSLNDFDSSDEVVPGIFLRLPEGVTMRVPSLDFDIKIDFMMDDFGNDFTEFIWWDYREARGEDEFGGTLLIVPSNTLSNFAIVNINYVENTPVATEVMFDIGDLEPTVPLRIEQFYGYGLVPRVGFTFVENDGTRRFFTFAQLQGEEALGFFIQEFYQDNLEFLN